MNSALPANLISPSFAALDDATVTGDITFIHETSFLFKCWQSYDAQKHPGYDTSVPRCCNLFWRVWSNPNLRAIPNHEFNRLWQRCGQETPLAPFRPNPAAWKEVVGCSPVASRGSSPDLSRSSASSMLPRSSTAVSRGDMEGDEAEDKSSSESHSTKPSGSGAAIRPSFRRNVSARGTPVPCRGGRVRPGMARRKSSQGRVTPRTSDSAVTSPQINAQDQRGVGRGTTVGQVKSRTGTGAATSELAEVAGRAPPAFELASSWQSEKSSEDERQVKQSIEPSGSLVEPDFRSKFVVNQRHLSVDAGVPFSAMRKTRSSVRFADEAEDDDDDSSMKGKGKGKEGLLASRSPNQRERSDSQVLTDSDDSDRAELPRVQSQLSMMITDRRRKTGSQDLGPLTAPQTEKSAESIKKREELLRMGREGAAPNIPKSRRSSREEDRRWRSPSPTMTF